MFGFNGCVETSDSFPVPQGDIHLELLELGIQLIIQSSGLLSDRWSILSLLVTDGD